jgi:Xaa-Pro aminopeptidase
MLERIEDGSMVILFCGEQSRKLGDEFYPFTPNRSFYYMTGLEQSGTVYMGYKQGGEYNEAVFTKRYDEVKAKWVGAVLLPDEVSDISDIDDVYYLDELDEIISDVIFNKRIERVYLDLEARAIDERHSYTPLVDRLKASYPYIAIKNLHYILAELRSVKQEYEVDNIRSAIDITGRGVYNMLRNCRPDMYEYELEAYFDFELKRSGVRDFAFKSIVAGGENATVLHYSDNNCVIEDGSLVLADGGAQWEYYCGDITRTFPINGKFTDRQRCIYDIVLEGHDIIIDYIKAGVPFKSLNAKLKEYYAGALKRIGLITSDEEVAEYYYHGVSHLLGLETHDVGRHNEGDLKEGMVLTVEPGLYIAEEGIGIRIEDDVLVKSNGCEVLSADIIRTPKDIEDYMNG